ncbi:MAG: hypothetical protein K9H16_05420 [Bacteroidales bacterium]|nr:hypothetical protein [Bacteroidales bacterium]
MTRRAHTVYITILTIVVLATLLILYLMGAAYYQVPLEERYFHLDHQSLKPSGITGHGLGIFGSLFMIIGVSSYMARKRYRFLSRLGLLKHWLEFHIFLCTLGPILILSHTAFKFGGIVAISFWSMVAVFLSGIIGRFIYIQIPRSIEGRELSLNEVRAMQTDIQSTIRGNNLLSGESAALVENIINKGNTENKATSRSFLSSKFFFQSKQIRTLKLLLKRDKLPKENIRKIISLVKNEMALNRRIVRLTMMQNLFKYWHVAHLPFALVMLIIMVIHIVVTITFGYRWIF